MGVAVGTVLAAVSAGLNVWLYVRNLSLTKGFARPMLAFRYWRPIRDDEAERYSPTSSLARIAYANGSQTQHIHTSGTAGL